MTKISKRKMGELRWERLKQADRDGSLQKVCSRRQLGALVGITSGTGSDKWVYQLVRKGWLIETLTGRNGIKNVYEYHLGVKTTKTTKAKTETISLHDSPAPIIERATIEEKAKVVITLGELSVSIENGGAEYVATIIKSMR